MKYLILSASALAILAGCEPGSPALRSLDREAGSVETTSSFGTAVIENYLVHSEGANYQINLANRFASEVQSTVNFAFGSAVLDASAQAILRQQADWIRQFPEVRFRVYGHTDLVGSDASNRALGQRRADAVVNFLTGQGISRSRLEAVVSFGETQPLVVTEGRERRNRRTVTEVSGFVQSHPGVLNGRYAEIIFRDYVASAGAPTQLEGIQGSELATEQ
jgi:outer membrane protein OmpA-like peptidoglycan-associated protein